MSPHVAAPREIIFASPRLTDWLTFSSWRRASPWCTWGGSRRWRWWRRGGPGRTRCSGSCSSGWTCPRAPRSWWWTEMQGREWVIDVMIEGEWEKAEEFKTLSFFLRWLPGLKLIILCYIRTHSKAHVCIKSILIVSESFHYVCVCKTIRTLFIAAMP